MADQPRYDPLEGSTFFANGMASRPAVEGAVARGQLRTDTAFYEGKQAGELVDTFPLRAVAAKLNLEGDDRQQATQVLERGQQRFEIYCAPCHGRTGQGNGMVVARGFPAPPSFHSDRLRAARDGHFFDVATRGFGRMNSYAAQVSPEDRWAIVGYIRALQLSQHADASSLTDEDRRKLAAGGAEP
ncbi:MAG TPA: c-type cytochrome [Pirellulales bacterium]|jgi:mono/diheme cytochrome c family protein